MYHKAWTEFRTFAVFCTWVLFFPPSPLFLLPRKLLMGCFWTRRQRDQFLCFLTEGPSLKQTAGWGAQIWSISICQPSQPGKRRNSHMHQVLHLAKLTYFFLTNTHSPRKPCQSYFWFTQGLNIFSVSWLR